MKAKGVLHHHPFCPHSRGARAILLEAGIEFELKKHNPWDRVEDFLIINPTGTVPVFILDGAAIVGVHSISEFISDYLPRSERIKSLLPKSWQSHAENRRIRDWYETKFANEVSDPIILEHVYRRQMPANLGGGAPETEILRQAMQNLKPHLNYLDYLLEKTGWLIDERVTFTDLIVAAQLSCLDYFNLINWQENERIKEWYARIKSRPSFQPLLTDRIPGVTPPSYYTQFDF